jgi:hypothetical protein
MPVETAADLAGMFDEDEFAEPARYQAPDGGGYTACSLIVDRGQGRGRFEMGRSAVVGSERVLWARRAEIELVERAGLFEMLDPDGVPTGEAFRVAGDPVLDQLGALWSCELLIVD